MRVSLGLMSSGSMNGHEADAAGVLLALHGS